MHKGNASPCQNQAQLSQTVKPNDWQAVARQRIRLSKLFNFAADGEGRKWRLKRHRLRTLARIVASYCTHGRCFASIETLAVKFGMSPAQTCRYLKMLHAMGIVVRRGLIHEHGSRIRIIDPSRFARPPATGDSRLPVNSFGLKKGLTYRPAYEMSSQEPAGPESEGPLVRQSENPGMRERDASACANLRCKSFRKNQSMSRSHDAVPPYGEPTTEQRTSKPPQRPLAVDVLQVLDAFDEPYATPRKEGRSSLDVDISDVKDAVLEADSSGELRRISSQDEMVARNAIVKRWWGIFCRKWEDAGGFPPQSKGFATHFPLKLALLAGEFGYRRVLNQIRPFFEERRRTPQKDKFACRDFLYDEVEEMIVAEEMGEIEKAVKEKIPCMELIRRAGQNARQNKCLWE